MSRGTQITAERRRRNTDALTGTRKKLAVTGALDQENFAYRWANDEGNRLHELTVADDWEVVQDRDGTVKPDAKSTGTEVSVPVGTGEHGRPVRAVLLRKRKDWHEDDKRQKLSRIDAQETALKAGASSDGSRQDQTYTPRGGIVIAHGGRS